VYRLSPEGRERILEASREVADPARGSANWQRRQTSPSASSRLCSSASDTLISRPSPGCTWWHPDFKEQREEVEQTKDVLDEVRCHCQLTNLRDFARQAGIDPANLARVLKGRSKPSQVMLARLESTLIRAIERRSESGQVSARLVPRNDLL
jgi:transcriptional regulator with XRE-family HTH domain